MVGKTVDKMVGMKAEWMDEKKVGKKVEKMVEKMVDKMVVKMAA